MMKTSFSQQRAERLAAPQLARSVDELERILRAGRKMLTQRGYSGLRIDDVLAEAQLSTRAFYRHFSGKLELFLALFEAETARAADRLASTVAAAGDPSEQVRAWVAAVLSIAYDPRLARRAGVYFGERPLLTRDFPDEVERCVRVQLQPLEDAIAAGRNCGDFPDADPARDARAVHHLASGFMSDRLVGLPGPGREEAVALVAGMALQSLRSPGSERGPK